MLYLVKKKQKKINNLQQFSVGLSSVCFWKLKTSSEVLSFANVSKLAQLLMKESVLF